MKRSQGEREQIAIEQLLNISSIYSILFIYSQTSSSHIRIQLLFSNCCQTSGTRIPFSISSTKLAFLYQSFIGIPSTKVQFHWYFSTNPPILGSLSRERMLSAVQWFQYWGGVASIVGTLVMVQTLLHAAHIHIKTREFKTREPKGWFIQGGGGDVFTHLRRNWKWIEYKIKKYIGWKIASRYNATR